MQTKPCSSTLKLWVVTPCSQWSRPGLPGLFSLDGKNQGDIVSSDDIGLRRQTGEGVN